MSKVKSGDYVQVHYTGALENGDVFDSSEGRGPLEFQAGGGMVIPGFNDSIEEMQRIVVFFSELDSAREINLLPYHELGKSKYGMLDKEYPHQEHSYDIDDTRISDFREYIESHGILCRVD